MREVFLDYNATAPLKPQAAAAMQALMGKPHNPSSIHRFGRAARKEVEAAREELMSAVGIPADQNYKVIFTASGTEANNLAIKGLKTHTVIISSLEHPSVMKSAEESAAMRLIPVNGDGVVDVFALEKILADTPGPKLVSVMAANNETGVIQPIKEIAACARRYNAVVHTDAVQMLGKMPVDMAEWGVDMMTLSAHKCGGPVGAAALIIRKKLPLLAIIQGGGQEQGYRAGTENTLAIAGFGAAVSTAVLAETMKEMHEVAALRDRLEQEIKAISPEVVIAGEKAARLPNTSLMLLPGIASETQLIHFDLQGIAVSSGSACSSGKVAVSQVLLAMGFGSELAGCALRVSLGWDTGEEDIRHFCAAWKLLYARVKQEVRGDASLCDTRKVA